MSAVLKEQHEEQSLSLIPVTELFAQIDFYDLTEDVVVEIEKRIKNVETVVFDVSEDGKKELKKYQSSERKLIKDINEVRKAEYTIRTESVKKSNDLLLSVLKKWDESVSKKADQFEEFESKQLDFINKVVNAALTTQRTLKNIEPKFMVAHDLSPLIKLTGTLTPGQQLTKKANDFIAQIVDKELLNQSRYHSRVMELENLCLRADINPPLTEVHLGAVFLAEDEVFRAKVNELITAEIARRVEMEMRIEKQNAIANQKKINDALAAQQAEADRIASEKAKDEETSKPVEAIKTVESLRAQAASIEQAAQYADRSDDRDAELKGAANLRAEANALEKSQSEHEQAKIPGKKTVTITAQFKITVSERISVEAVINHLKSKLPDDLKAVLIDCTGY